MHTVNRKKISLLSVTQLHKNTIPCPDLHLPLLHATLTTIRDVETRCCCCCCCCFHVPAWRTRLVTQRWFKRSVATRYTVPVQLVVSRVTHCFNKGHEYGSTNKISTGYKPWLPWFIILFVEEKKSMRFKLQFSWDRSLQKVKYSKFVLGVRG